MKVFALHTGKLYNVRLFITRDLARKALFKIASGVNSQAVRITKNEPDAFEFHIGFPEVFVSWQINELDVACVEEV